MTGVNSSSSGDDLFDQIPRVAFVPDTIWVDDSSGNGLVALSKHTDPDGWHAAVSANAPVITQVDFGGVPCGRSGSVPSSPGSQPSIVASMLEVLDVRLAQAVISTAALREVVPRAWLDQLKPGGRLVTPWGTDWSNGVMLTLDLHPNGVASGRFSGDLAFMRLRSQRRALYGWQPHRRRHRACSNQHHAVPR